LAWQELEYYAFIHFNMNTFTNKEWGYGDEKPSQFNPTELDTRQWARVAKGSRDERYYYYGKTPRWIFVCGLVNLQSIQLKILLGERGKGDLIRELSEACKEYGLKFGIYLSPWDRNHPDYGTPEYISYFRNQLKRIINRITEKFLKFGLMVLMEEMDIMEEQMKNEE